MCIAIAVLKSLTHLRNLHIKDYLLAYVCLCHLMYIAMLITYKKSSYPNFNKENNRNDCMKTELQKGLKNFN